MTIGADEQDSPALYEPVRKQRAFESVLEQVESRILDGRLRPGDRLPNERALSQSLDISRPSLREALRVLEAMDIITVRTGIGAAGGSTINDAPGAMVSRLLRLYVALGHFTVTDVVDTRRALERRTVREAATARTTEQLGRLHDLITDMDRNADDPERYFDIDSKFHVAIAEAAGNPLIAHLMAGLRDAFSHQMLTGGPKRETWPAVVARASSDHRATLAAIEDADPDAAEAAILHHLAYYSAPGDQDSMRANR